MKRHLLLLSLIVSIIIIYSSCKKEKENPCLGQQEVSADFLIEEGIYGYEFGTHGKPISKFFETDTSIAGNRVSFTAKQDMDEYYWVIGNYSRRFTTKSVTLILDEPRELDIMLVGKRAVKKECFPNDDGIDTVIKHLVVKPDILLDRSRARNTYYPLLGSFEGYHEDEPGRIFTIKIQVDSTYPNDNFYYVALHNLPEGCDINKIGVHLGYNNLHIGEGSRSGSECAKGVRGWAGLHNDRRNIIIEYDRCANDIGVCNTGNLRKRIFHGNRK